MLISIGETYLEVTPSGKRKIAGDVIHFLQSSYLNTTGVYTGDIGDDENGKWLEEESQRLLEGGFVYLPYPEMKTLICHPDKKGKKSFINVDGPFYIPATYFFHGLFEQFKGEKFIIDLSCSLLRKEEAYQSYLDIFKFRKEKRKPLFIMDLRWEKELFFGKEEEVKERMKEIVKSLDVIVTDSACLKKLYEGKTAEELIASIPNCKKKAIFLFDKDEVYLGGKEIYRQNEKVSFKKKRPFYYGTLLTLLDQEKGIHNEQYLSQDHFLALLSSHISSGKKDDLPFVKPEEFLAAIEELKRLSSPEPEYFYEA